MAPTLLPLSPQFLQPRPFTHQGLWPSAQSQVQALGGLCVGHPSNTPKLSSWNPFHNHAHGHTLDLDIAFSRRFTTATPTPRCNLPILLLSLFLATAPPPARIPSISSTPLPFCLGRHRPFSDTLEASLPPASLTLLVSVFRRHRPQNS